MKPATALPATPTNHTIIMARPKKTLPADFSDASIDQPKVASAMALMRADAVSTELAAEQHASAVRAVAQRLGYQLPADATDPDLIQRDIASNMRRSVEACLEVGRGLRVLKEACAHGNFLARLEVLGIETRVAQRFMNSAVKFSNAASTPLLKAIGNQTKLFEMLVLDDEQIEELELTGQTGELSLDDVATMSVKELRTALRELRAEHGAAEEVRAGLHKRIDKLQRDLKRIEKLPPDEQLVGIKQEATAIATEIEGMVCGALRHALMTINNHGDERGLHDVFLAGLVGNIMKDLVMLRDEFNLPELGSKPEWQTWNEQNPLPATTGSTKKTA